MNAPRTYARETVTLHSVAPDLIPQDAPRDVWNSASNVLFRNNESLRVFGDSPTLTGSQTVPETVVFLGGVSQGYWVYCTTTGVFAHDGETEFDITPVTGWTGSSPETFTSAVLNGIAYVNGSGRDPVYWAGDVNAPAEVLPDWPVNGRCLALRAHKNFLFAVGFVSEGGQRVRWSDAAEAGTVPQFWTPAADNLAGFLDLAPLASPCLEGETLRDSFLIYKGESIWSLDFVGGNAVFQARLLFAEHGIVNTNAVTRGIDDVHLFVASEGDVMLMDGVRVRSVLDGRAQRTFYRDFAETSDGIFSAATLAREKLGIVIYPIAGAVTGTQALLYDFASGDIGFRDMPNVKCAAAGQAFSTGGGSTIWDADQQPWDLATARWNEVAAAGVTLDDVIVGADGAGFVLISDNGAQDFITGPVAARLSKGGISFGNAQAKKLVSRVWPKVAGEPGTQLTFRVGAQDITGGPIELGPAKTFTIGQTKSIDTFVKGRFLGIEVSSQGGAPWRMGSIDIEYREAGAF